MILAYIVPQCFFILEDFGAFYPKAFFVLDRFSGDYTECRLNKWML